MDIADFAVSSRELLNWQQRNADTAHQREVADLKAAGLNPVLSSHTNGASVPSGASDNLSDIIGTMDSMTKSSGKALTKAVDALAELADNPIRTDLNGVQFYANNELTNNSTLGRELKSYAADMASKGTTRIFGIPVSNKAIARYLDQAGDYLISKEYDVPVIGTSAYNAYQYYKNNRKSSSGRNHGFSSGSF